MSAVILWLFETIESLQKPILAPEHTERVLSSLKALVDYLKDSRGSLRFHKTDLFKYLSWFITPRFSAKNVPEKFIWQVKYYFYSLMFLSCDIGQGRVILKITACSSYSVPSSLCVFNHPLCSLTCSLPLPTAGFSDSPMTKNFRKRAINKPLQLAVEAKWWSVLVS